MTLIHPLVVHFPIALWTVAALFDVAGLARPRDPFYPRAAFILVVLGLLGAAVSVVTGFMDFLPLVAQGIGPEFENRHRVHMASALAATGLFLVSAVARWRRPASSRGALVVLSVVGAGIIAWTNYLGGEMRLVM